MCNLNPLPTSQTSANKLAVCSVDSIWCSGCRFTYGAVRCEYRYGDAGDVSHLISNLDRSCRKFQAEDTRGPHPDDPHERQS